MWLARTNEMSFLIHAIVSLLKPRPLVPFQNFNVAHIEILKIESGDKTIVEPPTLPPEDN